jgi:hypothetical protein
MNNKQIIYTNNILKELKFLTNHPIHLTNPDAPEVMDWQDA